MAGSGSVGYEGGLAALGAGRGVFALRAEDVPEVLNGGRVGGFPDDVAEAAPYGAVRLHLACHETEFVAGPAQHGAVLDSAQFVLQAFAAGLDEGREVMEPTGHPLQLPADGVGLVLAQRGEQFLVSEGGQEVEDLGRAVFDCVGLDRESVVLEGVAPTGHEPHALGRLGADVHAGDFPESVDGGRGGAAVQGAFREGLPGGLAGVLEDQAPVFALEPGLEQDFHGGLEVQHGVLEVAGAGRVGVGEVVDDAGEVVDSVAHRREGDVRAWRRPLAARVVRFAKGQGLHPC